MKKIIKNVKTFYKENENVIKTVSGVVALGIGIAVLCDNAKMKIELNELQGELVEGFINANNTLKKSQSKVKDLVENGKTGTDEWHDETMQSTYSYGCAVTMDAVAERISKII